jgi:hypothetical protein
MGKMGTNFNDDIDYGNAKEKSPNDKILHSNKYLDQSNKVLCLFTLCR